MQQIFGHRSVLRTSCCSKTWFHKCRDRVIKPISCRGNSYSSRRWLSSHVLTPQSTPALLLTLEPPTSHSVSERHGNSQCTASRENRERQTRELEKIELKMKPNPGGKSCSDGVRLPPRGSRLREVLGPTEKDHSPVTGDGWRVCGGQTGEKV